jgi:four helix bundle protein
MSRTDFEKLAVYQLAEDLADSVWDVVQIWGILPRDTVGKQAVRAADSIGANIAEGAGRGSFQDNRRFVRMARGSLYETKHWLRRAHRRKLLAAEQTQHLKRLLDELSPRLNAYLKSIGKSPGPLPTPKPYLPPPTDH